MRKISLYLLPPLCVTLLSSAAWAGGFVVPSGVTVTYSGGLDTGETGIVQQGGAIEVSDDFTAGIFANADNTIENAGRITANGFLVNGIFAGNDNRITNSGLIEANGEYAGFGIFAGDGNIVNNTGVVSTGGSFSEGIYVANGNRVTNSGSLSGSFAYVSGDRNTFVNSGRVSGVYIGVTAISDNEIINSGTIIGGESSVYLEGSNNTLRLLTGSNIQGLLYLGSGNTVDVEPGLNTALSYEVSDGVPKIRTNGTPYAISQGTVAPVYGSGPTGTIAVIDPTGFSAQDEMLIDLTRVIADNVDARLAASRQQTSPGAVAMGASVVVPTADATPGTLGMIAWAAGLAQGRNQKADGVDVGFRTQQGGFMLGLDGEAKADIRLGGFIGGSMGRLETDTNSQSIDTDSYFGGLYASLQQNAYFLNVALAAGVSKQSSNRTVANNIVAGGIEHAKADYDAAFLSPSATIGTDIALPGAVLTPSLRARYAALSTENYEEHGSEADLSVGQRTAQAFDGRAQFAMMVPVRLEGGTFTTTVRLGGDATYLNGDRVDAVLLGQSLDFNVGNNNPKLQGCGGLDVSYSTDGGTRFFAGTEYGIGSEQNATIQANAGIEMRL